MILSDLRDYLRQHGQATLGDMALHFDTDPQALRGMLEIWVRKGRVEHSTLMPACGSSCNKCDMASTEIYRWRQLQ